MVRRRSQNPPWADLPRELLSDIANLLTSERVDILAFRAVCKSWNSSAPSPPPLILCPPLPITIGSPSYCLDPRFALCNLGVPIITATAVFAVSCREEEDTKSWLLFADQLNPGKIMIRQPFTKKSYQMPVNFPRYLDAPNIRVSEIARFYNCSFYHEVNKPPNIWSEYFLKVVLNSDEMAAVALYRSGQLGLTRLIPGDGWVHVQSFGGSSGGDKRVDHVVYYKGKILSVDRAGRLYEVGYADWQLKVLVRSIPGLDTKRKRLVESNGELYLVVRGSVGDERRAHEFTILKLHKNLTRWVRVSDIGGRSFFFGLDFSFSVLPQDLGESSGGNCIIYKDGSFRDYDRGIDDDFMRFMNVESEIHRIAVWPIREYSGIRLIGSYPGYPNVLWPPPAWIWPNDISKHLGDNEAALPDGLNQSIPDQNSKIMSIEPSPLEQVPTAPTDDNTSYQDASKICKVADTVKKYLDEVGDIYKHIESYKTQSLSRQQHSNARNLQDQEGLSISEAEERKASVSLFCSASEHYKTDDCCLSNKRNLNDLLLNLEECTSKLQNTLKSYQQEAVVVVDRPATKPPVLITYTRKRRKGNTINK